MKIKNFVDILRGGNLALGSKLSNLLTEDCTILEYTNDSVLFSKGSKLVLAKFKNPLTEAKMTSSHIIDNEILEISKKDLTESMKTSLTKVIEGIISENLVDAQEHLDEFCQTFYQMSVIKNRYPSVFVEELQKSNKGIVARKEAKQHISAFKAELFSNTVVNESNEEAEVSNLMALVESKLGLVLALGKTKVASIVEDALLGNKELAESVTANLYTIAEEMGSDSPLGSLKDDKYDLERGGFADETDADLEDEEIPSIPTEKEDLSDEDESKDFEPFNPAMFSEEEIKQLHKTTLKSILLSMQEFIHDKASDSEDTQIDPDLADQIDSDLLALEDGDELGDDRLSEIEARWNPMISYFLDSSYHTPAEELADEDELPVEDQLQSAEESTPVESIPEPAPAAPAAPMGAPAAPMAPPMGAPAAPMM
jgi:hypothetical protein